MEECLDMDDKHYRLHFYLPNQVLKSYSLCIAVSRNDKPHYFKRIQNNVLFSTEIRVFDIEELSMQSIFSILEINLIIFIHKPKSLTNSCVICFTEVLCCAGVGPQTFGFNTIVPTLAQQNHQIGRTGKHQIRIGKATVTSCDNLATNGVIHTINKVLIPQRHQGPSFGMFLFDV